MTAPLFYVPDAVGWSRGATIELTGDEGHHAARVVRLRVGEDLLVSDGAGCLAHAVVASVAGSSLTCTITHLQHTPAPRPPLILVQALAKAGRDESAIEAATELGVDMVVPWLAGRCVVQWKGDKATKGPQKWRSVVTAASRQSRRAAIPKVLAPHTTAQLAQACQDWHTIVLHESAMNRLATASWPTDRPIALVVGPEGGIAPDEVELLVASGAHPMVLGDTVVRSSTAGPAALAVALARVRW